jgi:hypothetical protein
LQKVGSNLVFLREVSRLEKWVPCSSLATGSTFSFTGQVHNQSLSPSPSPLGVVVRQ